jgi:hypothetical protein
VAKRGYTGIIAPPPGYGMAEIDYSARKKF